MGRWFSSDLHIGHANVIGYCGRPYAHVDAMDDDLIARLNACAGPSDELWLLGDHALGRAEATLPRLAGVTAELHLVMGNHDRCHPSSGPRHAEYVQMYQYLTGAASLTLTDARLRLTDGTEVSVSHFPWLEGGFRPYVNRAGRSVSTDRFARFRPVDDGGWLLCGHVHGAWRQQGRVINVGVDAWGGRPVSEDQVLELIHAGPADRDALAWS